MKLAAFAPTQVVEALAKYYMALPHDEEKCPPIWNLDVQTYLEMRNALLDGIESKPVTPAQLYFLMWDCQPEERGEKPADSRPNED